MKSNPKRLDLKQGSQEWLNARKGKITASIVANCIGAKGAFKSPKEQALIIRGLKEDKPSEYTKQIMQRGIDEEPSIRRYAEHRYASTHLEIEPAVFINEGLNPLFLASLDGEDKQGEIYEFKYSKNEFEFVEKYGEPSPKYMIQVQFQLLMTDMDKAFFIVKNSECEGEYTECTVYRDEKLQKEILKKLDAFIETYLLNDDWLSEELEDKRALEIVARLREIKEQIKPLNEEEKTLKNELLEIANGKECTCNGAKISRSERATTDYKAFLKDNGLSPSDNYIKKTTIWSIKL